MKKEILGPKYLTDHDGTMTDSDKEAEEYGGIVTDFLSKELGIPESETQILLNEAYEEVRTKPQIYAWTLNGVAVAPALSDHYQVHNVAIPIIVRRLASESKKFIQYTDETNIRQLTEKVFFGCSPRLSLFYREGAKEYIKTLSHAGDFRVITNSDPNVVREKMRRGLGDIAEDIPVIGGAKKYAVDLTWTGVVPEGMYHGLPSFPERGVNLQRKIYYMTLMDVCSGDIKRARMVGDIAELDLLMIDYLGGKTALILSGTTAPWEKRYYQKRSKRRFASTSLEEIADWITEK